MPRLHFGEEELAERRRRTCERLRELGLDALLMFRQESMYYLTGYDTAGYAMFQCLVLRADGDLVLVTRFGRPGAGGLHVDDPGRAHLGRSRRRQSG